MPLSTWGGFARGLSEGLRGVATIRGIKASQAREERDLESEERAKRAEKTRRKAILRMTVFIMASPTLSPRPVSFPR